VGPEHPNVAVTLNNLVLIHSLQGDYLDAEPLARRSLSIFEKAPAREKSNLLQSLENLAGICLESGKYDESEQLYRRALSIRWGASTDGVVLSWSSLQTFSTLRRSTNRAKKPFGLFKKPRDGMRWARTSTS
jgi:tetratricopeptide (TPR) repeat protein